MVSIEEINTWIKEYKGQIVAGTLLAAGSVLLLKDVIIANSPPNAVPYVMIGISFAQFAVEHLNKKEKNEVEEDKNTLAVVINDNKTTIDFLQLQAGKLFDAMGISEKDDAAQQIIDQIQETASSAVAKNEEVLQEVAPEAIPVNE